MREKDREGQKKGRVRKKEGCVCQIGTDTLKRVEYEIWSRGVSGFVSVSDSQ